MTKGRTYSGRCPNCGAYPALCAECGGKTTGSTPFSDWLRKLKRPLSSVYYDCQNLDYIWFQYRQGWFITIEEKMLGLHCNRNQKDTHGVVVQLLEIGSETKQAIETMRGKRMIEYRGHYELTFENTTPDNSEWLSINSVRYPPNAIYTLLSTGRIDGLKAISPAARPRRCG
jgi:hypothetical protein